MAQKLGLWDKARSKAFIKHELVREPIGEFIGTFVLCLIAVGSGMSGGILGGLAGALGLYFAIILVGGVSGGHVNPAVTLALCIAGKCSWVKLPLFWVMQYLGGFLGAFLAGAVFYEEAGRYASGSNQTLAACQAFSFSNPATSIGYGFLCEVPLSAFFIMGLFSLIDKHNMGVPKSHIAIFLALIVGTIGFTFGKISGTPVNPARDLSPRLAALAYGCPSQLLFQNQKDQHWWLVGTFGPYIGAIIGALVYIFAIGAQDGAEDQDIGQVIPPTSGRSTTKVYTETHVQKAAA